MRADAPTVSDVGSTSTVIASFGVVANPRPIPAPLGCTSTPVGTSARGAIVCETPASVHAVPVTATAGVGGGGTGGAADGDDGSTLGRGSTWGFPLDTVVSFFGSSSVGLPPAAPMTSPTRPMKTTTPPTP